MDCSVTNTVHTAHTHTHTNSYNIRLWSLGVWLFLGSNYSAKMIWQVVSEDMKFALTCSLISHVFCQHPFNMRFSGFQKTKSDRHKNRCWVPNKQSDQVHSMFKIHKHGWTILYGITEMESVLGIKRHSCSANCRISMRKLMDLLI